MAPRDGDPGDRRRLGTNLLLAASDGLYGALLALYPKAFRRRYAPEMRRDFCELSREGLAEGGGTELVRVWASTLSDLVVTALKERSTVLARNAYLPVDPRIAARAMVAVMLVAFTVVMVSLRITPQYEASSKILVGKQRGQPALTADVQQLQQSTLTVAEVVQSRPIAEDTIERLELSTTPNEFLERLDVEPIENTTFIEVSYTDPYPGKAQRVANTVGYVLSNEVSEVSVGTNAMSATLWERAPLPEESVSPNALRNGVLTLVFGLVLCMGLALALPRVAALGTERAAHRATRAVDLTTSGSRRRPTGAPATEAAKEKELLDALERRGGLTVAGAALETSLTVEEADRMLSALAVKGHLEVTVEHGRLLYSLWEGDAPL
jgi:capsular polysaccharide biosynthesis protein